MRFVFTDGWNSSWHVLFGMMAYYNLFIILLFAYYQFILKYDYNSAIDFVEFLVGYMLMWAYYSASAPSAPSEPEEPEEKQPGLKGVPSEGERVRQLASEIARQAEQLTTLLTKSS
jgi:hypothetical protein